MTAKTLCASVSVYPIPAVANCVPERANATWSTGFATDTAPTFAPAASNRWTSFDVGQSPKTSQLVVATSTRVGVVAIVVIELKIVAEFGGLQLHMCVHVVPPSADRYACSEVESETVTVFASRKRTAGRPS